jgi:hypothetical protein
MAKELVLTSSMLVEKLLDTVPSIIYIAIGSANSKQWEPKDNQQFPPFLHDFKINNMNINIKIVLIDPLLESPPYITTTTDSFLSDAWYPDKDYNNIIHNEYNVDVFSYKTAACVTNDEHGINISELLKTLANSVSQNNQLLFYHDYTGINTFKVNTELDIDVLSDKICIDITRGSDLSCCFDLSDPENYPYIKSKEGNKLFYVNPQSLKEDEKRYILKNAHT